MIRVETVRGPAYMASALINDDVSSFDDDGRDTGDVLDYVVHYEVTP